MEIYIIRHTSVNIPSGICYGQSEVELNDTFFDEALKLKTKLPNQFDVVITSPLIRCKKLADFLTAEPILDDRLKEMHFGDWEMKPWVSIPRIESQAWMDQFDQIATPNGESFQDVYARVSTFYTELKQKDYKNVLLVTHAGPIRCLWTYLLGFPLLNAFKIPVSFGEVLIIQSTYDTIVQKS